MMSKRSIFATIQIKSAMAALAPLPRNAPKGILLVDPFQKFLDEMSDSDEDEQVRFFEMKVDFVFVRSFVSLRRASHYNICIIMFQVIVENSLDDESDGVLATQISVNA
jgi:hypothetical protein